MNELPPFEIGDQVITDFFDDEKYLVRVVTNIMPYQSSPSRWIVSADNGGICEYCNRPLGTPILGIDADFFKKAE